MIPCLLVGRAEPPLLNNLMPQPPYPFLIILYGYYYDNAVLYTYNTVLSYSTGINSSVQYSTLAGGLWCSVHYSTLAGMDCTLIQY